MVLNVRLSDSKIYGQHHNPMLIQWIIITSTDWLPLSVTQHSKKLMEFTQPYEINAFTPRLILQMRELQHRGAKWLVPHCKAGKWWNWVAAPGNLTLASNHNYDYATISANKCYLLLRFLFHLYTKIWFVYYHCLVNGNHI